MTFPALVDSDGRFVSHVQEEHNVDATDKQSKGLLHLEMPTFEGKKLRLRLSKNRQFIAPGLVIEKEGQMKYYNPECHYEGHIIDQPNSSVSISYCRGLVSANARLSWLLLITALASKSVCFNPALEEWV